MTGTRGTRRQLLIGCCLAAVAVYVIFALTPWGQRFDNAAKFYSQTHRLQRRMRIADIPSLRQLTRSIAIASAAGLAAAIAIWAPRRALPALGACVAIIAPSVVACELLKPLLPRPDFNNYPSWIGTSTLPSGHVAFVAASSICMYFVAPLRWRRFVAALSVLLTVAIMLAVVLDARHRPSDTIAAVLVVGIWVALMQPWLLRSIAATSPTNASVARASHRLVGANIAIGTLGLIVAALAGAEDYSPSKATVNQAFVAAIFLTTATALGMDQVAYRHFQLTTLRALTNGPDRCL
jgi:membrane-associated phospholipid phosphatase